jgi:hypothetical protein
LFVNASRYFVTANFGTVTDGEHVAGQSTKLINPTGLRKLSGIARATAWSIADCETLAGKSSGFGNVKFIALQTNAQPKS